MHLRHCIFHQKEDMQIINDKYNRKARFLRYKENKDNVIGKHYQYTWGF